MRFTFFFTLLITLLFTACERVVEDFDNSKLGYEYFPLEVGKTWTYQVDSTIFDDIGTTVIETSSQVKEEIVEEFIDEVGDTIFRIERYWRKDDSSVWTVTDVWVAELSDGRAIRTEENLKFIKLVFPATEGVTWDGNIFFDESVIITVAGENLSMFAGWNDYEIIKVDIAEEVGGITYDQVLTVLQTDDENENTIDRRYALEKYAKGVGLVYKEQEVLHSQSKDFSEAWKDAAEKGFILKQTLIEYN